MENLTDKAQSNRFIINTLMDFGMSRTGIARICGTTETVIARGRVDGDIPDVTSSKLPSLFSLMAHAMRKPSFIDPAALIQEQIVIFPLGNGDEAYCYLYELWTLGITGDKAMLDILGTTEKFLSYSDLADTYGYNYTKILVENSDSNGSSLVVALNIPRAEESQIRKHQFAINN